MSINPFSYGKPVDDPDRFVGHHREIQQVYSRLLSAFESSSIVGERRIGKTSLLKVLGHPTMQAKFGANPEKYTFIYQDFQFLGVDTKPTRFWQRVLRSIRRAVKTHEEIVEEIEYAVESESIDNYTLDDIFSLIDEQDLYIVLLLDEFENVTRNENFDDDFFAGLRALAIHHNLALITSSRQELVELTHSEKVRSSPFFNIFANINLRPFTETEATELIDKYLVGTDVNFLLRELNVVFAIAGYHPHFLQMACHHLFAAYQQNLNGMARCDYVVEHSRREAEPIFQDYWHNSSVSQQIVLTVLALREFENRIGKDSLSDSPGTVASSSTQKMLGQYDYEDSLANLERFYVRAGQVLPDLEARGLVIENSESSTYHLFSTELSDWIVHEIIGEVDDPEGWRDWLKTEVVFGGLSAELQKKLSEITYHLNPAYRDTLGKWLLESATAKQVLQLLENCVGSHQHQKVASPQRRSTSEMAIDTKPIGDTPKGLFARVTQRLDSKDKEGPAELSLDNAIASLDKQQRDEMIYSIKRQLLRYIGNLNKLQEDAAMYGSLSSTPLKLQNEIEEIEITITELEEKLEVLEQAE